MRETAGDLAELQDVLDRSHQRSGEHLRSAFDQEHRLSATELATSLVGIFEMHLAVVTSDGKPLVAPVDGFLLRGKVCVGLPERSVRARLLRRDPSVSASYIGEGASFIVHGTVTEVGPGHDLFELFSATARDLYVAQYGDGFAEWMDRRVATEGPGFSGIIEPRVMFAKA